MRFGLIILSLFIGLWQLSYASSAPSVCSIVKKHPSWLKDAKATASKYGVPVYVQLAIIQQESKFKDNAKNHHSSARGYAQALNNIWSDYEKATTGKQSRDNFQDSSHFIGWYAQKLHKQLGISPKNAYSLYLAYHDGSGGYRHDLHHKDPRSKALAHHVQYLANLYKKDLSSC